MIFLKAASYAHQGCIYSIISTVKSNIVKYYYYNLEFFFPSLM